MTIAPESRETDSLQRFSRSSTPSPFTRRQRIVCFAVFAVWMLSSIVAVVSVNRSLEHSEMGQGLVGYVNAYDQGIATLIYLTFFLSTTGPAVVMGGVLWRWGDRPEDSRSSGFLALSILVGFVWVLTLFLAAVIGKFLIDLSALLD